MTVRLGENMQREWDAEPFPGEIWEALQLQKNDPIAGQAMLTSLARQGSTLAMMYLGASLINNDDDSDIALGEEWLIKAAAGGSLESRVQLFGLYEKQKKDELAIAELKEMVRSGYAPAIYLLGLTLYQGLLVKQDTLEAVKYLKMAQAAGHLPAIGLLAWIYRKEDFGLSGRIAAHWYCVTKIPSLAWYLARYPNSDRLRGMKLP